MWGFQRLAGAAVWGVLVVAQWVHASFVVGPAQWWLDNVVVTAEESTKAALREYFGLAGRLINGAASWAVALLIHRDFRRRRQRPPGHRRSRAWADFWARNRQGGGTLNAVIEQEGFIARGRSPERPSPDAAAAAAAAENGRRWWWSAGGGSPAAPAAGGGMRRSGSDLFGRPSGFAAGELTSRRGLGESLQLGTELAVESVFAAFRSAVSALLLLRLAPADAAPPARLLPDAGADAGAPPKSAPPLRRSRSFGSWEDMGVWTASDVILQSGYPLEEHVVTTSDGYILTMQRIPRKDSTEAVFFQHGILDTALGWVANGPEGSQAFAAYDAGADVWLGNCRANPPRAHADPGRSGAAYWAYSINELGMEDVAAQIFRIHAVKSAELGGSGRLGGAGVVARHRRSGSDTALAALHGVNLAAARMGPEQGAAPPNEERIKAHNLGKRKVGGGGEGAPRLGRVGSSLAAVFSEKRRRPQRERAPSPEPPSASAREEPPPEPDRLTTPDRVSVGGREQAPLQWARAPASAAAAAAAAAARSAPADGPYRLQAVGHSLGGAALLIYAVMARLLGRPHHLSRLVLLTPAGFHRAYPKVALPFLYLLPGAMRVLNAVRPGLGAPAYIPSSLLRYVTFKLSVDLQRVPALNELTRAALRAALNGDASEWDRALQMPHYAVASMPALSLHSGHHLIQLMAAGRFLLYDYGSAGANRRHYGTPTPPDVAAHYPLLGGLPVDLVAGRRDGVIAAADVATHYEAMRAAGLEVTLKELDVGHLDVTFAVKEEVRQYVLSRLRLAQARRGERDKVGGG